MTLEGMQIGHYRLRSFIGSGAMGEVYLAEDTRVARQVAVKVLKNEGNLYTQATEDALRLFQREMKAVATLDHPNILPLFDFGEQIINKATCTYMVMPYRKEGSLVDWLQQRNNTAFLSPQEVVHIVRQAADALQHAHNRHLMHLDVKPSNFLIRQREDAPDRSDVLLADFGIAKFTTATSTVSQTIRGTPAYMAPEQWAGTPVVATDQYALAVMTYQLLTGMLPFEGNMQQVMYKHLQESPQAPSAFNPQILPEVDRVILRALEKKPEDRFPSVMAFARAFQETTHSTPIPPKFHQYMEEQVPLGMQVTPVTGNKGTMHGTDRLLLPSNETATTPAYSDSRHASVKSSRSLSWRALFLIMAVVLIVILGSVSFAFFTLVAGQPTAHPRVSPTALTDHDKSPPVLSDPYTHTGALVLEDPLQDNSRHVDWMTGTNPNQASCTFVGGAYQSSQPNNGDFHACFALNTDYSNFVFEVQMTTIFAVPS
jgi:serine/threonine protein kinase